VGHLGDEAGPPGLPVGLVVLGDEELVAVQRPQRLVRLLAGYLGGSEPA
jgi:hypothetical protein